MNKIILDLTQCKTAYEIHETIQKTFNFPDFYGKNFAALWDCLRDYCESNTIIYIKGLDCIPEVLKRYAQDIVEVFEDFTVDGGEENVIVEII